MVSSIKVVLYVSKTLKNGEHPVMLRMTKDRKVKYLSLGASCSKNLWNENEGIPKSKHPLYKELLNKINKKKLEASKLLLEMDNEETDFSAELLQSNLKSKVTHKRTLFQYFDEVIDRLEREERIGYANTFQSVKNGVKKFRNDRDMEFSDITPNSFYSMKLRFMQEDVD